MSAQFWHCVLVTDAGSAATNYIEAPEAYAVVPALMRAGASALRRFRGERLELRAAGAGRGVVAAVKYLSTASGCRPVDGSPGHPGCGGMIWRSERAPEGALYVPPDRPLKPVTKGPQEVAQR